MMVTHMRSAVHLIQERAAKIRRRLPQSAQASLATDTIKQQCISWRLKLVRHVLLSTSPSTPNHSSPTQLNNMPLSQHAQPDAPVLQHFSLKGKKAAVTGGARGIGLEVCRGLAEAGADVALLYTQSKDADDKAAEISRATGVTVKAYKTDVRDKDNIDETLQQVAKDFGRLDICVANAGIVSHHDSLEYTQEQWSDIVRVNLDGAMYTAQAAGKIFRSQGPGSGRMIFTASVSGSGQCPQKQSAYNATKAAVIHLAKSLAVEWVDFATVNCISPGFIETDMLLVHPQEWRDKWFEMIPGRRLCQTAELKGVSFYMSGYASASLTKDCRHTSSLQALQAPI